MDILARDGEVIVVVEVKTRRGAATRVLPSEQQRRLVRASDWAQSRWGKPGVEARVDLVRVDASEFRWWRPWPRLRIERGIRYSRGL